MKISLLPLTVVFLSVFLLTLASLEYPSFWAFLFPYLSSESLYTSLWVQRLLLILFAWPFRDLPASEFKNRVSELIFLFFILFPFTLAADFFEGVSFSRFLLLELGFLLLAFQGLVLATLLFRQPSIYFSLLFCVMAGLPFFYYIIKVELCAPCNPILLSLSPLWGAVIISEGVRSFCDLACFILPMPSLILCILIWKKLQRGQPTN